MKIFKLFLLILISLTFSNQVFSEDKIIENLKEGGKIIFIRHAYAPGGGDPQNFNINDCSTQRNLSDEGINQSKLIGEFFKTNKIQIDKVLSSEWCRCKDTAKFAFNDFETAFYKDNLGEISLNSVCSHIKLCVEMGRTGNELINNILTSEKMYLEAEKKFSKNDMF